MKLDLQSKKDCSLFSKLCSIPIFFILGNIETLIMFIVISIIETTSL